MVQEFVKKLSKKTKIHKKNLTHNQNVAKKTLKKKEQEKASANTFTIKTIQSFQSSFLSLSVGLSVLITVVTGLFSTSLPLF